MTDKLSEPNTPPNHLKPVRLLREDSKSLFATETPPKTPQFGDSDSDSDIQDVQDAQDVQNASNWQALSPLLSESSANNHSPLSALSGPIPVVNGKIDEVSEHATLKLQTAKPPTNAPTK